MPERPTDRLRALADPVWRAQHAHPFEFPTSSRYEYRFREMAWRRETWPVWW